jgi:ribose transport system substrate-binding protein
MFNKKAMVVGSTVLMLGLAACGSSGSSDSATTTSSTSTGSTAASTSGKALSIGYAAPVAAQAGNQLMMAGANAAADSLGWKVTVYDSNIQTATQITNIQTMIQKKVDYIGSWTLDPGATAGIYGQAISAGIPVIGVNSNDSGIKNSVYYQTQLCEAGGTAEQTAKLFATKYPGGTVITVGLDGVPSIDSSVKCFTDAAKAAGLKVVAHVSNTSDGAAGGQKLIGDLLTKYPDVNAVWAYNDTSALGASAALISSGKKISDGTSDGVLVTGTNGDADAIKAVSEGRLTGTWDPNNTEFGWLFVKMVQAVAAGDAPKQMTLKSTFIDAAAAKTYVAEDKRDITLDNLDFTTS